VYSSVVSYDGARNVKDEERSVWQRTPEREQKEETKQSRWGFRGMTVRDWLQLLIVPLALVVIGFLFSVQQDARQQRIEDQRAKAERELAEQRAQDEALQAYLDQMGQLMLDRKLLETEQDDPVHTLAQARTSTVILRLDAEHNASVIRFLSDSGLAVSSEASPRLLRDITLSHATLSDINLSHIDLTVADLSGADLSGAVLDNANLTAAILSDANLSDAYLGEADLSGAYLRNANLREANLRNANLSDAYLRKANLSAAQSITSEELEQQAASLEGATMPNGQKYEDWLKSKNRNEGQEDDGSS
jgi:cell division protein FtsB